MQQKIRVVAISMAVFLGSIYAVSLILSLSGRGTEPDTLTHYSYNELRAMVEEGAVQAVILKEGVDKLQGVYKDTEQRFTAAYPKTEDFHVFLLENDVQIQTLGESIFNASFARTLIMIMVALLIIGLIMRRNRASASGADMFNNNKKFELTENVQETFSKVAGNEEAKDDLIELIDFVKERQKFVRYGAEIPKGTILYGPPGTGKTLMAKALAGEAGIPFIYVSGSDFVEKFVGVGASRIRELFKLARSKAPCIIFIDEIDAVAKSRQDSGGQSGGDSERDQTLNQLLAEIDGFDSSNEIMIVAATNRLDTLDSALLRSGRFNRQIYVGLPDVDARYEILKIHAKNKPISEDIDLYDIAKMTLMMSGADLENILNEASIYAARRGHDYVEMHDIDSAINKIVAGEEKKSRASITQKDKEITAYHEAGHALVAKLKGQKVSKLTIVPTSKGAGGYAFITPNEERMYQSRADLLNNISIGAAGRIAEEIVFGEDNITTGAAQDLKTVTRTAITMVGSYGMSKRSNSFICLTELLQSSNGVTDLVVTEAERIISEVYEDTKQELIKHKAVLNSLALTLLEKETIYEKEIESIVLGKPAKKTKSKKKQLEDVAVSTELALE